MPDNVRNAPRKHRHCKVQLIKTEIEISPKTKIHYQWEYRLPMENIFNETPTSNLALIMVVGKGYGGWKLCFLMLNMLSHNETIILNSSNWFLALAPLCRLVPNMLSHDEIISSIINLSNCLFFLQRRLLVHQVFVITISTEFVLLGYSSPCSSSTPVVLITWLTCTTNIMSSSIAVV